MHWTLKEEFQTADTFGYMWECPDLFSLDENKVLSVSPQGLAREAFKNQNVYQSGYFLLKDGKTPSADMFVEWDMGFDFYAPQTFLDEKGRRILVGWAGLPDVEAEYQNPTVALGWQHVLTTPRELSVRNGRVVQTPVEEVAALRKKEIPVECGKEMEISGGCFDLELTVFSDAPMRITLEKECVIGYQNGVFTLEFQSGAGTDIGCGRKTRRARIEHLREVRILSDESLLEIYVNGGETVFTTRYYPNRDNRSIRVEADGTGKIFELAL